MEGDHLASIDSKSIKDRDTFYRRLKAREMKRMGMTDEMPVDEDL